MLTPRARRGPAGTRSGITCGTNLARAGRRPEEIAAWLGHHAASFSLDTYVGRPSATKVEGVDLLDVSGV